MFSECHDETDQAIHDRLIQLEEQIEATNLWNHSFNPESTAA
jgi:hypothetical protein